MTTVDIHAHYYPEAYLRLVETEGPAFNIRLNRSRAEGPSIDPGRAVGTPLRAAFWDLDRRRKEMDRQGVDVHALSLTYPMTYWADGALATRLARVVNDAIAEACTAFPDRFVGLATLPLHEPAQAIEELDRAAKLPGMRGVYIATNVRDRELAHPDFAAFWERVEALSLPVFLHPGNVVGQARLAASYYLNNLLGNPFDTAVAATHLIFGGVLDRHPRLRVCLPHAGGALPYLIGRVDRGHKMRAECAHLKRRPSSYLRRFTYDTVSHSPAALRYLVELVGTGRVMLGSDYCFDMGYERPVAVVKAIPRLGAADRARILGGNAARLLGIQ